MDRKIVDRVIITRAHGEAFVRFQARSGEELWTAGNIPAAKSVSHRKVVDRAFDRAGDNYVRSAFMTYAVEVTA